jgi:hypothetical protein
MYIRKGGTPVIVIGPFVDASDGVTPETGLTIAAGEILGHRYGEGTMIANANGGTHLNNGLYKTTLGTGMTANVGPIEIHAFDSGTTSLPVMWRGVVLGTSAFDMMMGTGKLPVDVYNIVGTVQTAVSNLQGTATTAAAQSTLAAGLGTSNATKLTNLQGTCDVILADTDELQSDNYPAMFGTQDANFQNIIGTLLPNLQGTANAIVADTNELQTDDTPSALANIVSVLGTLQGTTVTLDQVLAYITAAQIPAATIADAVWDEQLTGASHNVPTSAGRRLRQLQGVGVSGAIDGGTSNTGTLYTDLSGYGSAFFQDQLLVFTSGSLTGQCRPILVYGADGHIEFDEQLTQAPAAADAFDILPDHIHSQSEIGDAVWEHNGTHYSDPAVFGGIVYAIGATQLPNIQGTLDAVLEDTGTTLAGAISNLQGTATDIIAGVDNIEGTLIPNLQGTVNAILTDTDVTLPALINALENVSAAAVGTAIWNYCVEERDTYTAQQVMSTLLAVISGVTADAGLTFKTPDGNATRVAATVNSSNERTAMVLSPGTGTGV